MKKTIVLSMFMISLNLCDAQSSQALDINAPSLFDSFKDQHIRSPFDKIDAQVQHIQPAPKIIFLKDDPFIKNESEKNPGNISYREGVPLFSSNVKNNFQNPVVLVHKGKPIDNELLITTDFLDAAQGSINHQFPFIYEEEIKEKPSVKISFINMNNTNDNILSLSLSISPNTDNGKNLELQGEFSYSAPVIYENHRYYLDVSKSVIDINDMDQPDGGLVSLNRILNMKNILKKILDSKLSNSILYSD